MGITGPCLEIKTCDICACYGTIFGELDEHGHGKWSNNNLRPSFLPEGPADPDDYEAIPWASASFQLKSRGIFHAAAPFLPTTVSQIGGHPSWVQDLAYPACCKCHKTMIFVAQLDCGDLPHHEGVYYAFLCRECRVTATAYQQT